jgi:type II secretory pathway component GspD/PulD (secretin)
MRNASRRVEQAVPWFGRIPGVKRMFGSAREMETKIELVILLRPIVVDDAEDWPRIIQPSAQRVSALGT